MYSPRPWAHCFYTTVRALHLGEELDEGMSNRSASFKYIIHEFGLLKNTPTVTNT